MATAKDIATLDKAIWVLIFGGLFLVALGISTYDEHLVAGWSMGVVGAMLATAGAVLVWVRSRLREDPPDGAKSESPP